MAYQSKYTGLQIDDILDSVEYKQDQIEDLESIRAGAAKGATALQSYTEKYTGTVTGIKINGTVKSGSGVIDLGTITTDISGKVDKVAGKQLSTEDFTTALKNKLEGLNNYDDTELSNAISTLRGDFDEIVSGDTTTAIKTFNEVIAFLDGLTDTQNLESIIASIEQQIAGKMDKVTLATVATSGSYNDLSNKPTIPSAVTESTVSGWGFTKNTGTYSKPSGGIPKTDLASAVQTSLGKADTALQSYTEQYKGTVQSVATSETLDEVNTTTYVKYVAQTLTDAQKAQARTNIGAAAVGEGGSGSTLTESDIAAMGFTKNTGTVTGVKINGTTKNPSSGVVDLGTVITSHQDISGKQDKLVSGTNIKTINGTSILGSGNITISGGSSIGGSGEDNRYFTEFTVEEFIEGCIGYNMIPTSIEELSNAVNNNKIICVPYNNCELGFLIATYNKSDSETPYFNVNLEGNGVKYSAYCTEENDFGDPVGLFGNGFVSYVPQIMEVESSDGQCYIEMTDNVTYYTTDEINYLYILPYASGSSTVRFITGNDPSLEMFNPYILWANGKAPVLEPYTSYELSIVARDSVVYAVLVPFKSVE